VDNPHVLRRALFETIEFVATVRAAFRGCHLSFFITYKEDDLFTWRWRLARATLPVQIRVIVDYAGYAAATVGVDHQTSAPKGNHDNRDGGGNPQQQVSAHL
jgi:hypothetical protein